MKDGEATLLIVGGLLGQVQDRKLHALRNDGPAKMGDPWSYQQERNVGDACRWHIVLRYIIYIYIYTVDLLFAVTSYQKESSFQPPFFGGDDVRA